MKLAVRLALALSFSGALAASASPVAGKAVSLEASDGTKLAATFYAGATAGPGVLLLHQCNSDRSSWNGLAAQLADKGFHVLTLDYRGYGESGGTRYTAWSPAERARMPAEVWPGDVDVAFAYLKAQPGVKGTIFGAGGASCGVNQSIQLARRHPEVKSLALLSGNTNREGRQFLRKSKLPLFIAAADDDGGIVQTMEWLDAASSNPKNRFIQYKTGGHGTDMFKPHPDLPGDVVAWYETSLLGKPAAAGAARPRRVGATARIMVMMDGPEGSARVAEALAAERKKNPKSEILETGFVNQLGYEAIQSGDTRSAIAIMQINVDAQPESSNALDSLGDAYLAAGKRQEAYEATRRALAFVDSDPAESEERRTLIRQSAQQKMDQLKDLAPQ